MSRRPGSYAPLSRQSTLAKRSCDRGPCNVGDTSADCITRQETNFDSLFNPFSKEFKKANRKICKTRNRNFPWAGCGKGSGLVDKSGTLGCCDGKTGCVAKGGNNNVLAPFEREAEAFDNQFISGLANTDVDGGCRVSNSDAPLPFASQGTGSLNIQNRPTCVAGGNNNALGQFERGAERFDNMFQSGFDQCKRCRRTRRNK